VSTRNKKKVTRKPKANAVKSKRRPHKTSIVRRPAAPHDRAADASPTARLTPEPAVEEDTGPVVEETSEPVAEETTEPVAEETTEPVAEETRKWAPDDPNAMWWDDVWPFKVEPADGSTVTEAAEEGIEEDAFEEGLEEDAFDDDDAWVTAYVEPDDDPALAVPPLSVPPDPRSQGLVWLSVLVTAALVVGVIVWWAGSRGPAEQPVAIQGHPYAAPVHLGRGSSFVRSKVLPSGDVVVKHWIRTGRPVDSVSLVVPQVTGLPRHALSVSDLVLASNGTRTVASSPVHRVGATSFALPPTHRLYVRYRLSGVVESSGGSGERALARITALDVTTPSPVVRTTLAVVGAQVLALACTPAGQEMPSPCGTDTHGTWSTRLGESEQGSQVMAQLNLS
jgi:hypothetical protein